MVTHNSSHMHSFTRETVCPLTIGVNCSTVVWTKLLFIRRIVWPFTVNVKSTPMQEWWGFQQHTATSTCARCLYLYAVFSCQLAVQHFAVRVCLQWVDMLYIFCSRYTIKLIITESTWKLTSNEFHIMSIYITITL